MSTPGKVSVIIPCYNYGRFLKECVDSVRAQSYQNWEAIIVDDGSSDNSLSVGQELASLDPTRIKFFRTENRGVSAARNFAIEMSSGEYILPLDADDALYPYSIERFVEVINSGNYAFAYGAMEMFGGLADDPNEWFPGQYLRTLLPFENSVPITSLWRRSFWEKGVSYKERFYEDWDLWLQILALGGEGKYLPEKLFKYRYHIEGRDTWNKYFYYPALSQQILGNPSLYRENLYPWAKAVLHNAPECFKSPTFLFLPFRQNESYRVFQGRMREIADAVIAKKHFAAAFGFFEDIDDAIPGLLRVESHDRLEISNVKRCIDRVGAELIVVSDYPPEYLSLFAKYPNVFCVVNAAAKSHKDQDIHLASSDLPLDSIIEQAKEICIAKSSIARSNAIKHRGDLKKLESTNFRAPEFFFKSAQPQQHISVVVPIRNVAFDRVQRCIESIREYQSPKSTHIVISDYGSHDLNLHALRTLASKNNAVLIESETRRNWSRARALNIGIRACTTPWVMFTDADMIFSPELIPMWREYHAKLGDKYIYLAQCKKLPPTPNIPSPWKATYYDSISAKGRLFDTYGHGGCQIVNRNWLRKVRGFNEQYEVWGAEDVDLTFRAEMDGIKTIWMQPGKLLHQWHIKAVPEDWKNQNRETFNQMQRTPVLIVNDHEWGTISEDEKAECAQFGRIAQRLTDQIEKSSFVENELLNPQLSEQDRVQILCAWGELALQAMNEEVAVETFEDVLGLDQANVAATAALAQIQLQRGNFAKAKALAHAALKGDPSFRRAQEIASFVEIHIERASAELEAGHLQNAASKDPFFEQYLKDPNRTDYSS
ncbi:MAG: glycosyltransferase family 2 protein [Bdellovibrionales bacterium]|nr:glycosyltransferase family 2 protein [Bdellovibrionales bacterium]